MEKEMSPLEALGIHLPDEQPEPQLCTSQSLEVMSERMDQNSLAVKNNMDNPDKLLQTVMANQIEKYQALSTGLIMGIMGSLKKGIIPENLISLNLKVDSHVLNIARLNKQLASPSGQINITATGSQFNLALAQQVNNSVKKSTRDNLKAAKKARPKEQKIVPDFFE